jgi:hypothetical protein
MRDLLKFVLIFQFLLFTLQDYNIGTGIADITGPPVGVGMVFILLLML